MAIKAKDKYLFEQNTYKAKVKDDDADRIEVEIGDSKQPDFKPQLKFMRWDNEVNFSIRAEEVAGATLEEDGEKIKYVTPDYDVVQYDKPEAGEDGGFEFEWVLKKKPKTNVLTTTIETKGLEFGKIPPITQEQKDKWDWKFTRPDVEGSYAVYHATRSGHVLGKKNYKTGKAFHIYRPQAIDANGNTIYCDIDIDYPNKTLRVTVPQDFLDNALYPVIVDPTFGFTSVGATTGSGTAALVLAYRSRNPGEAGTVTSMSAYEEDSASGNCQVGLYETGGNLVGNSTAIALAPSAAWRTGSVSGSITATNYDVCVNLSTDSARYYHDSAAIYSGDQPTSSDGGYASMSYGTWNSTVPTWTNWAARNSIYATYTAAPAGGGGDTFPVLRQNKFWTPRS